MRLALAQTGSRNDFAAGLDSARRASQRVVCGMIGGAEAATIFGSGMFVHWLAPPSWRIEAAHHLGTYAFGALLTLHIARILGGYRPDGAWSLAGGLGRLMAGWFASVAIVGFLSWSVTLRAPFGGEWFIAWVASATGDSCSSVPSPAC